jgi:hypothetical protein
VYAAPSTAIVGAVDAADRHRNARRAAAVGNPRRLYAAMVSGATADALLSATHDPPSQSPSIDDLLRDAERLGAELEGLIGPRGDPTPSAEFAADLQSGVQTALALAPAANELGFSRPGRSIWLALLAWLAARGLGGGPHVADRGRRCRERLREFGLDAEIERAFASIGHGDGLAPGAIGAILELPMWRPAGASSADAIIGHWLSDAGMRRVLGVRRAMGSAEFDAARFADMVDWFSWVALVRLTEYPPAYGRTEPPVSGWVADIAARLREIGRAGLIAGIGDA